jgi:hypothetical protein
MQNGVTMVHAPLPYLTATAINRLAVCWDDGGLWADVSWLARRFHNASEDDAIVWWHHLVLAVGNFKRQPGRRLRPGRLADRPPPQRADLATAITVPRADPPLHVARDELQSWQTLRRRLPGAVAATTTTLLAAL